MCKAFSAIVMQNMDVLWKLGVDSHEDLIKRNHIRDTSIDARFARVEITPDNDDYINPDRWVFRMDKEAKPDWWTEAHEQRAHEARELWYEELDKLLVRKPIIHPFRDVTPPKRITKKHIKLLKKWQSVGQSVWQSVWHSVGQSVWQSVRQSVWQSVGQSVWQSVWQSVRQSVWQSVWQSVRQSVGQSVGQSVWQSVGQSVYAYTGSFFNLPRSAWKYTEAIKTRKYPFQPAVDLWELGLVPSYDGTTWRLYGGPEGAVLFEISAEELRKS